MRANAAPLYDRPFFFFFFFFFFFSFFFFFFIVVNVLLSRYLRIAAPFFLSKGVGCEGFLLLISFVWLIGVRSPAQLPASSPVPPPRTMVDPRPESDAATGGGEGGGAAVGNDWYVQLCNRLVTWDATIRAMEAGFTKYHTATLGTAVAVPATRCARCHGRSRATSGYMDPTSLSSAPLSLTSSFSSSSTTYSFQNSFPSPPLFSLFSFLVFGRFQPTPTACGPLPGTWRN